ncbi:AlpA family phage regulatory protein [Paraburkholderia sp. FT54]|uniref:helix-turn-helix transcriptional regulator n=1 Tax=Paraburkholderia sp. FT54 TaxID=3074437 RepID=UPI0028779054|nr:AlpA family phage regulatory protein [Paraburkholderia sp. FT54]WNC90513.1 AlpA family phage regulatory protein [Paraburkholderia sp. FT54]
MQQSNANDQRPAASKLLAHLIGKLPEAGYVRQSQLIPAIVPFSSATLWRKVKNGTFPRPVKLSERVTAWDASAVREYLADPSNYRAEG